MSTTLLERRRQAAQQWSPPRWSLLAVVVGVALRLTSLMDPATPDEGGYLVVAHQWSAGGSSLYGDYWVDRPPLLLAIYQFAAATGGLVSLRLVGCLAVAVTVLSLSITSRWIGGRQGAWLSAVVSAALLVSPVMGSAEVNGELLAAPFVATGIMLAVAAIEVAGSRAQVWSAAGTGACGVAAILVKQNMAEVFVFASVAWLLSYRTRRIDAAGFFRTLTCAALGACAASALVAMWTLYRGTSLSGVFDAMYSFRLQAAQTIPSTDVAPATGRLAMLLTSWAVSGGIALTLCFVWALVKGGRREPVGWAVLAISCFTLLSMLAGGGYWSHYLVETVVPLGLMAGLVTHLRLRSTFWLASSVVLVAVLAWSRGELGTSEPSAGTSIGTAIGEVAGDDDTIISAFGAAETVQTSGLSSPYPYLWNLPAQTLDSDLTLLRSVLSGPHAPTWFVVGDDSTYHDLQLKGVAPVLDRRYSMVATVCGREVYLLDGIPRAGLHATDSCAATLSTAETPLPWTPTFGEAPRAQHGLARWARGSPRR